MTDFAAANARSRPVRLLVALCVLALVASACGSGSKTRTQTSATATPKPETAATTAEETGKPDKDATPTPKDKAKPAEGTAKPKSSPTPPPCPSGRPPAGTNDAPAPVVPGTYRYTTTTRNDQGSGEARDTTQVNDLVTDRAQGNDQHSKRKSPDDPTEKNSQEKIQRYQSDGIFLVEQRANSGEQSREFRPQQPQPVVLWPATLGRTWSSHLETTDGSIKIDEDDKVVGTETIRVAGEAVETIVIEYSRKVKATTGTPPTEYEIPTTGKRWYSPAYRLIVRDESVTQGQIVGRNYRVDANESLSCMRPIRV